MISRAVGIVGLIPTNDVGDPIHHFFKTVDLLFIHALEPLRYSSVGVLNLSHSAYRSG